MWISLVSWLHERYYQPPKSWHWKPSKVSKMRVEFCFKSFLKNICSKTQSSTNHCCCASLFARQKKYIYHYSFYYLIPWFLNCKCFSSSSGLQRVRLWSFLWKLFSSFTAKSQYCCWTFSRLACSIISLEHILQQIDWRLEAFFLSSAKKLFFFPAGRL